MTLRPSNARRQRDFAAALLDPDARIPAGIIAPAGIEVAQRFAVHRNNVISGLVGALRERFPAVVAIVGQPFFDAVAAEFVRDHPPANPVLAEFGDGFDAFLAAFPPAQPLPYLADVARVEAARTRVFHGPDDPGVGPSRAIPEGDARLAVRGAAEIVRSDHPVVTIWEMNAGVRPVAAIADWSPEWALVVRCGDRVAVRRSDAAGAALLAAAHRGPTPLSGCASALRAAPSGDPIAALAALIDAGAVAIVGRPHFRRDE